MEQLSRVEDLVVPKNLVRSRPTRYRVVVLTSLPRPSLFNVDGKERSYDVLKRCRLIPSFLIFDSSVCLGMPSFVAAPVGPETSPSDSRSAVSIISFSWSIRLA